MANLTRRIANGTAIVMMMLAATALASYGFRLILSRTLSMEDFGLFFAVFNYMTFIFAFRGFGLSSAVVRIITEARINKKPREIKDTLTTYTLIQFAISGTLALLTIIFVKFIAKYYFHNEQAAIILIVLALGFLASIVTTTLKGLFHAYKDMVGLSMGESLPALLSLLFVAVIILFEKSYLAPTIAFFLALVGTTAWAVHRGLKTFDFMSVKTVLSKKSFKRLFVFGFVASTAAIGDAILNSASSLVLTYFRSLEDVALFNVALPTANILRYIPRAITQVFLPIVSELDIKRDDNLKMTVKRIYKYMFIGVVPFAFLLSLFSNFVMKLLFGAKFEGAGLPLSILAIGMVFQGIYLLNQYLLLGLNKPRRFAVTILAGSAIAVTLNLLLVRFGLAGMAFATAGTSFIMYILSSIQIRRTISNELPVFAWIKTFLAAIMASAGVLFLMARIPTTFWTVALASGSFMVVYAAMLWLTRAVTIREARNILSGLKHDDKA